MKSELYGRELNKGEFILREWIGDGGFGDVYRAEQPKLGREVVVKVLRQRLRLDSTVMRRFIREAQLAARLDHPYAAHVYAFGAEPDGLLWIAMELVHGVTLDCWLTEREPLTLDELVPFLERVADVVQTAHDNGIIHRDLKPANIMVIERAGKLLPKLLDFGLAKLLDASLPDDAEIAYVDDDNDGEPRHEIAYVDEDETASEGAGPEDELLADDSSMRSATTGGQPTRTTPRTGPTARPPYRSGPYRCPGRRVCDAAAASGSPPYMAPEQWIDPTAVGPSSDLYALAIVAYEALTGRRPYTAFTLESWSEAHRVAPVPPLGEGFPPALDRFFQRALAKRPEDRWGTAIELAAALRTELEARLHTQVRIAARQWQDRGCPADLVWRGATLAELERWLQHAGAPLTRWETEFVEASRAQAVAIRRRTTRVRRGIAAIGVATLVGAVAYPVAVHRRAAEQIVTQAKVEQGRQAVLAGRSAEASTHLGDAYQRGDHSSDVAFMLGRSLQPRLSQLSQLTGHGRMWSAMYSRDGKRIVTTDDASAQIWDARTNQLLFTLPHGDTVYQAVHNPDGTKIITACGDGAVRIWDVATGTLVRELKHDAKPRYLMVATSPDGKLIAAIDTMGAAVHVWDLDAGTFTELRNNKAAGFASLAFSADGRWLATSGGEDARIFDLHTFLLARSLATTRVRSLSFDPSGTRLVTGAASGDASIWEIPSGQRVHHLREVGKAVDRVAFSPDGQLVVAASHDGAEQVWNARSGSLVSEGNFLRSKISSIEFDSGSKLVLAAGTRGSIVVSDASQGVPVAVLDGPQGVLWSARFDPSSQRIIGASMDGTAWVWDATPPYRRWSSSPIDEDCGLVTSLEPDRRFVAVGCRDRATRVWDTARDLLLAELPSVTQIEGDFDSAFPAVSDGGDRAAIARGKTVVLYELPGGRELRTIVHTAPVNAVAFAPSGRDLVSGAVDGSLLVTRDGGEPFALPPASAPAGIDVAGFLPDGRVVAADARGHLRIFAPGHSVVLADLEIPARAGLVRASSDGRRMLTIPRYADKAPPVLWDLAGYRLVAQLAGHLGQVRSARWVRGDREILTAGIDGFARTWDGVTGRPLQAFRAGTRFLADAALAPDGSVVVAGDGDGLLWFWGATGRQLWTLQAHASHTVGVHFEGGDIITRGFGGEISRWSLPDPELVIEKCGAGVACGIVPR